MNPTADVFVALARDAAPFFASCAAQAAREIGLFAALAGLDGGGWMDHRELIGRVAAADPRVDVLLGALAATGQVRGRPIEGGYVWQAAAVDKSPAPPPVGIGRLGEVMRTGTPLDAGPAAPHQDYLAGHADAVAATLYAALPISTTGRLLDVGGGHGRYSRAWLDADPFNRATIVDLPAIIAALPAPSAAHRGRLRTALGPIETTRDDDLEGPFDVGLLANVLHLHDGPTCAALLSATVARLRPGATLIVKDLLLRDLHVGPATGALFGLAMIAYTRGGRTWTVPQLRALLGATDGLDAGTVDVVEEPGGLVDQVALTATVLPPG